MLNERRVVLVVNRMEELQKKFNFEAIKICEAKEIESVWNHNKTPLILKENLDNEVIRRYSVLEIPEFEEPEEFIAFCHSNGFESGEYISGQKFDTSKDECIFCDIVKHRGIEGPTYVYNQRVKEQADIIIYESKHFFVKIELGCLKKGMLMICPKMHVLSIANVSNEKMEEYFQIMKDIEFILKSVYGNGPVIFFEHGSAPNGLSSHKRSIVHAHVHVAWGIEFEQKYLEAVCLKPVESLRISRDSKYFSFQRGTEGELLLVNDPEVYVQRQYPRQVIGKILGIENEKTNWRKEAFYENITATFDDFYNFLKEREQFLPERIVVATEGFVKGYPLREDFSKK